MLWLQVEQAERSVAQLVSDERERQRTSEMREEFSRLAGTVQSVSQKITENNSQMKEIGDKISSLVISSRGGGGGGGDQGFLIQAEKDSRAGGALTYSETERAAGQQGRMLARAVSQEIYNVEISGQPALGHLVAGKVAVGSVLQNKTTATSTETLEEMMRSLTQSVGVSVSPADLICRHQLGQTKRSCQVCYECEVSQQILQHSDT